MSTSLPVSKHFHARESIVAFTCPQRASLYIPGFEALEFTSVSGCKLYYNQYTARFNIPYVGECTIPGLDVHVDGIVADVISWLNDVLNTNLNILKGEDQIIGKRFKINSFVPALNDSPIGEVRVVTESGYPITVSIALADLTGRGVLEGPGTSISDGVNLGTVYLKDANINGGNAPDGQKLIPRFVVYAADGIPDIDLASWKLSIKGVDTEVTLSYSELTKLSTPLGSSDFHCVTGWSVPNVKWTGIRLGDLVNSFHEWVYFESVNGYVTVMPREEALQSWIITGYNGKPLSPEHGSPARVFNPSLYGWKSAKWLTRIWSSSDYIDGLWEALAYHERGRVQSLERFKVRNLEVARNGLLPSASPR